ncbi:MAG: Mur ligase domain-containing protein, partial [Gemmatimonadota bacterium]
MSGFTWTDAAVRRALDLRVDLAADGLAYEGVSTDSRTLSQGDLYVALVGDRFDGHDFVADALARGARGAVVSRQVAGDAPATLYPVADTLMALGALAAHRRRALEVPVVGITGSSGKTTTKDMT